ncbi:MAG TPA: hypothetical protein VFE48_24620 [Methylomirabilota bacterium]|nr:hypothetical protein [Methylomirabilota bacterium]
MADPEVAARSAAVRLYSGLHHLLLAATIASVTLLLQQFAWFTPFDLVTRGVVSYVQAALDERERGNLGGTKGLAPIWNPDAAGDRPLVVIVNNLPGQAAEARMHPMAFAAELVRAAAQQKPRVLAIGLDLDPYFDDPLLNQPQCGYPVVPPREEPIAPDSLAPCDLPGVNPESSRRYVAWALAGRASLRQVLETASRDTTLVVTAPPLPLTVRAFDEVSRLEDPVEDRILLRRVAWTASLCEMSDVRVALRLPERGDALTFTRNEPSLGNIVWQVSRVPRAERGDVQAAVFATPVLDACAALRGAGGGAGVTQVGGRADVRIFQSLEAVAGPPGRSSIGILSGRYYETLAHHGYVDVNAVRPGQSLSRIVPPGLRDRVVFLGDDAFLTRVLHVNRTPEIDLQAAVYYSNLHGAIGLKHAAAFVLEVALGAVFGVMFAMSWGAYRSAKVRMDQVPAHGVAGLAAKMPLYLRARGWLAWNLALLAGIVWVMFYAAHWLLRQDIWINPVPLVIGMSLKGLLASRHLDGEHEPRDWWSFYNHHPDVVWQVPVIVVSVALAWYWRH